MKEQTLGSWAFIAGVVLAIILGLFGGAITGIQTWIAYLLIIVGLVVGFANIKQKEMHGFLVAAVSLLLVGSAGLQSIPMVGGYIESILKNIVAFVAPATLIIALKAIYDMAYKK
jgi:membrane-bound ClpP family serine protease